MNSLALLGLSQRETEVLACVIQGKESWNSSMLEGVTSI